MVTTDPPRPFGALPKPTFDPREIPYAFPKPAKAADWSVRVGATKEQRASIWDQSSQGSCVASICEALETAARMQGRHVPDLSHKLVYWLARERQGWVSRTDPSACQDSGAYLNDAADVALPGVAKASLWPYNVVQWEPPPAGVEADSPAQDWCSAHRSVYVGPGAGDQVYDALKRGLTITVGWTLDSRMYSPGGKPYPIGISPDPQGQHGFHASYLCRGFLKDGTVWIVLANSWGEWWNAGIETWEPSEMRPGEAAIPLEWLERPGSPVWELRVLDLEPFTPPEPPPPSDRAEAMRTVAHGACDPYIAAVRLKGVGPEAWAALDAAEAVRNAVEIAYQDGGR